MKAVCVVNGNSESGPIKGIIWFTQPDDVSYWF